MINDRVVKEIDYIPTSLKEDIKISITGGNPHGKRVDIRLFHQRSGKWCPGEGLSLCRNVFLALVETLNKEKDKILENLD